MKLAEIWRYPVKSVRGESVPSVEIDSRGLVGDRWFAVRDAQGKFGSGKTTRRFRNLPGLLDLQARTDGGQVVVWLPDGRPLRVGSSDLDRYLSERYGEPLQVAAEGSISHFDRASVHVLTTASLRWLARQIDTVPDRTRFRPNLLVDLEGDDLVEERWIGRTILVGKLRLRVTEAAVRCMMVDLPQGDLPYRGSILRALAARNRQNLGVYAEVVAPARIDVGDVAVAQGFEGFSR